MARRGYLEIENEDESIFKWNLCEINNCPNCICLRMSLSLCYPHGIEFGAFTAEEVDNERKQYYK